MAKLTPQDGVEAVRYYQLAAERGYAAAQCTLGECYQRGAGVPQDGLEAVRYYRLAVEQGYVEALSALGECYQRGEGVPQDGLEAVRYYRLAAEQGDAGAQFSLGECFERGEGVAQDVAEAVRHYRLAAAQEDELSGNDLASAMAACDRIACSREVATAWHGLCTLLTIRQLSGWLSGAINYKATLWLAVWRIAAGG
jgi:hypothetical protein